MYVTIYTYATWYMHTNIFNTIMSVQSYRQIEPYRKTKGSIYLFIYLNVIYTNIVLLIIGR